MTSAFFRTADLISRYMVLTKEIMPQMARDQAVRAVQLCEDIVADRVDLHDLNRKSLAWRGKQVP